MKNAPLDRRSVMTVSKAQQASVNKYVKANYDRINVTFPKGQKDVLKEHAEAHGYKSVNDLIIRSVENQMQRDKEEAGE